jgi:hypothetical protein
MTNNLISLISTTGDTISTLWNSGKLLVINLLGALIIFLIGWLVAIIIGKMVEEVLKRLQFNTIFEKGSFKKVLEKEDLKINPSAFVGVVIKWVLILAFLMASVEFLGLQEFAKFIKDILSYIPHVFVAVLIFIAAVVVSDISEKIAKIIAESLGIGYQKLIGGIVKVSVWVFASLAILKELMIASVMVNTLFTALVWGFIALIVLAGGIAFGLGGREVAADILKDIRNRFKK